MWHYYALARRHSHVHGNIHSWFAGGATAAVAVSAAAVEACSAAAVVVVVVSVRESITSLQVLARVGRGEAEVARELQKVVHEGVRARPSAVDRSIDLTARGAAEKSVVTATSL